MIILLMPGASQHWHQAPAVAACNPGIKAPRRRACLPRACALSTVHALSPFAGRICRPRINPLGDALDPWQAEQTNTHGRRHAGRVCLARAHSGGLHAGKRPAILDRDLLGRASRRSARADRACARSLREYGVHGHAVHGHGHARGALHLRARAPARIAPPPGKSVTCRTLRVRHRFQRRTHPASAAAERGLRRPACSRGGLRIDRGRRPRRSPPTAPSTSRSVELTFVG